VNETARSCKGLQAHKRTNGVIKEAILRDICHFALCLMRIRLSIRIFSQVSRVSDVSFAKDTNALSKIQLICITRICRINRAVSKACFVRTESGRKQ